MFNKKTKIIIFGIIIILLASGSFFIFRAQKKSGPNNQNINTVVPPVVSEVKNETQSNSPVVAKVPDFLTQLKNNHPEFTSAQVEFYNATAANKEMTSCLGKDDVNDCISSVAFLTRIDSFCGEINDKEVQLDCANIILNETAASEINQCQSFETDDSKVRCLVSIFNIYKKAEDCSGLANEETKKTCESVAYYQAALEKQDWKLCGNIDNEDIRIYCSDNIVSESADSDHDGLTDDEETNKYHTDPRNFDTDGDGYQDGSEVKNGFNPNGPGRLPAE
jgi:hypothetical protein